MTQAVPTTVCPECGRPPELPRSRTRSWLASPVAPRAILAILVLLQVIASATPHRSGPWWEPLTSKGGWFRNSERSMPLAELREIADRKRDPRELMHSLESGRQGLWCTSVIDDLPQVAYASAGVPPIQTHSVTNIGYPWTWAVLDLSSPGPLRLSFGERCAVIEHPRFRLQILFDCIAMIALIAVILLTVWRRVCPPRRRKQLHRAGTLCILAATLLAAGTPTKDTDQTAAKRVSIRKSDTWQYGEPWGATFSAPMPSTPDQATAFASALCQRIAKQPEITPDSVVYLAAESEQRIGETVKNYGRPIRLAQPYSWNAREFPAAPPSIRLDASELTLHWPNAQGARIRRALLIGLPNVALLLMLYIAAYKLLRLIQRSLPPSRAQRRLTKNLCPHCAYPIPTPPKA